MAKTKAEKPVILITNDDSISAPGIKALVEAVKDLGKVIVVAPTTKRYGTCHHPWTTFKVTKSTYC